MNLQCALAGDTTIRASIVLPCWLIRPRRAYPTRPLGDAPRMLSKGGGGRGEGECERKGERSERKREKERRKGK